MYNEVPKMTTKKKIEIAGLIIAIVWLLLFIFNYVRYTQSKSLLLSIHTKQEYEDGYVEEYIGLGYIYRKYQRNALSKEEFVPFWVGRVTLESADDLPKPHTGYEVPDNPAAHSKFRGLLYFFDDRRDVIGTYKCINTVSDCNIATGGYDHYNTKNKDPLTQTKEHTLGNIHGTYAFIDDSYTQDSEYGDPSYTRTIYLYKFIDGETEILARYADVKESTYDEDKELAGGDLSKYIVKNYDNNKWGLINISEKGNIEEILPFEYESITYDPDTKYYILCKDGVWTIYDLNNQKTVSNEIDEPIYDVWRNSNLTYYYKTGKDRVVGDEEFVDYKIYRIDGKEFLNKDKVIEIIERSNFVAYLTAEDKVLHFIDYSGEEKYKIQLQFTELDYNYLTNPAFEIWYEKEGIVVFRVYEGRDKSYTYENITVNTNHWEYN